MSATLSPDLTAKMLTFVQVSSALGKRAMDKLARYEAAEKQAAAGRAPLLAAMLEAGTIGQHQVKAATDLLATPAGAQQLLKSAVARIAEMSRVKTASLGSGVDDSGLPAYGKAAADPLASLTSPFVGQRTSEKKASDRALLRGLGLEE